MVNYKLFGGTNPATAASADSVAVIGLGRFGQSIALELMANGTDVLGIDSSEEIIQRLNGQLTHAVTADATNQEVLQQLSIPEFDRVVVAIGDNIEASILVTSLLLRFNVPQIWTKAVNEQHGLILEQLGVEHVVYPEKDMGTRVAHLLRGSMEDYIDVGADFAVVKTPVPQEITGSSLSDLKIMTRYGIMIIAVKRESSPWVYTTPETVLEKTDIVLASGPIRKVEKFSQTQ